MMQILTALFGWVPEVIAEWGLYGILLAGVGVMTEVTLIGALLMGAVGAVQFVLRYLSGTHAAFEQKSSNRWSVLGIGLGIVVGTVVALLVIGPKGFGNLADGGFVWGSWVVALVAAAVAALGLFARDHLSTDNPVSDLVCSIILGAGASVTLLYLMKGIIEVSQNSVVF